MAADLESADLKLERAVELLGQIATNFSSGSERERCSAETNVSEFLNLVQEVHSTVAAAIVSVAKAGPSADASAVRQRF